MGEGEFPFPNSSQVSLILKTQSAPFVLTGNSSEVFRVDTVHFVPGIRMSANSSVPPTDPEEDQGFARTSHQVSSRYGECLFDRCVRGAISASLIGGKFKSYLCRTFGARYLHSLLARPYGRAYFLPPLRGWCEIRATLCFHKAAFSQWRKCLFAKSLCHMGIAISHLV
jgi:hypothetical protein